MNVKQYLEYLIVFIFVYYFISKIIAMYLYQEFKKIKPTYYWNNKVKTLTYNKSFNNAKVIYFIHDYGGAPDQILLNKNIILNKHKGRKVIIKSANHHILSDVKLPIYKRYNSKTIHQFHFMIFQDIRELLENYNDIDIIVSSNGMYDIMSIYKELDKYLFSNPKYSKKSITILWMAMMGKVNVDLKTLALFNILPSYNGATYLPGNNYLSFLNNELSCTYKGYLMNDKLKYEKHTYKKYVIEGRIKYLNHYWSKNEPLDVVKKRIDRSIKKLGSSKIKVRCIAHVTLRDSFWNASVENARKIMKKHFTNYSIAYCNESHLWSVNNVIMEKVLNIATEKNPKKEYKIN